MSSPDRHLHKFIAPIYEYLILIPSTIEAIPSIGMQVKHCIKLVHALMYFLGFLSDSMPGSAPRPSLSGRRTYSTVLASACINHAYFLSSDNPISRMHVF